VNDRRYLPWVIAIVLPVLVLLWSREEAPPPQIESPPPQTDTRTPEGLELLEPARTQAPRPPDYYPEWSHGTQAPRFVPPEPPVEAYRFRPLTEREQRRMGQPSAGARYAEPYTPPRYEVPSDNWSRPYSPQRPRDPRREPLTPEPWRQGWGSEGYSYRPYGPAPGVPRRREGPYSETYPRQPYPAEPIQPFDEEMQWGATPTRPVPPSYRMYPALDQPADRSLTSL